MMLPGVRGYVLAGGESSRMQRAGLPADKAMLMWQGRTLLERAFTTVQQVCGTCRILCGTAERCARLGVHDTGIRDRTTTMGPLGGLEAALADAAEATAPWALLLPVDLPWMTPEVLLAFGQRALAAGSAASCMQADGMLQPLPAMVNSAAQAWVRHRLGLGERKLLPVLRVVAQELTPELGLHVVLAEELPANDHSRRCFWNLNTPEDYRLLQDHETLGSGLHQSTHGGERAAG